MSTLTDKSLLTLELPRVLDRLAAHAVCEAAKEACLALRPTGFLPEARQWQEQTTAARDLIGTRGAPSFSGIRDIKPALGRVAMDGVLNTRELLDVGSVLQAARSVKAYSGGEGKPTCLDGLFGLLSGNKYLEDRIFGCILSEEEIADGASPELSNIRRLMRAAASKVREVLQKYITSPGYSKYLQDSLITQRSGRYVIPVKAECKGEIPGLVHDVSSSGATLFIEPMPVVQAGNALRELEGKEKKEIERILAELSAECGSFRDGILQDYEVLAALDAIFARGRLSYEMDAIPPLLNDKGQLNFRKARHPLLDKNTAVPISVRLGTDFDTLVITGPNTGGKTVALKTLGLLTLMASCGLHIPAGDESAAPVTDRVYADIGDEQSISQNLSTFSSHMTNIVGILAEAGAGSMVLFDELGAGTDPVEGAALATAIIENTRKKGCRVAATTHYAELKMYALTTAGVENASCEFDVETLRPTYRLLIGIPGKSNAFAISGRLGLPEAIIESAQRGIGTQNAAFEDVLAMLEKQRQALENEYVKAEKARRESEEDGQRARELRRQIEKEHEKATEKARYDARHIIEQARISADEIMTELSRMRQKGYENAEMAAVRQKLNQAEDEAGARPVVEAAEEKLTGPVKAGDDVLLSTGTPAVVLEPPDKNGNVLLQAGIMKITAHISSLRPPEKKEKKPKPAQGGVSVARSAAPLNSELDIRGQMADEITFELDMFIDGAVMNKLESVRIIHGKGTGALRTAVHALLRKNKSVKSFRLGRYGEGESGVTIAELK